MLSIMNRRVGRSRRVYLYDRRYTALIAVLGGAAGSVRKLIKERAMYVRRHGAYLPSPLAEILLAVVVLARRQRLAWQPLPLRSESS